MYQAYISNDALNDYPNNMQAKHIADFLGIGIGTVYKILDSGDIPILNLPDCKLKLVPKSAFIDWYNHSVYKK